MYFNSRWTDFELNRTDIDKDFLKLIDLEQFITLFENEHVTLEILSEMSHKELKELGLNAYGHRHKILKGIEKYFKKCMRSLLNLFLNFSILMFCSSRSLFKCT